MSDSTKVTLGYINGVHGVRGWVKVFSYTQPIENILNYSPWLLYQHGQWRSVVLQNGRLQGKGIVAQLKECVDRDTASQLRGAKIAVYRDQLPPPEDDEYYWSDLMGLTVVNQDNITLGKVDYLLTTNANDVLVVKGEQEHLIPFLEHVIVNVDLAQQRIDVDWDADF